MKTRIYFLDNLRTFLILMVVVLHTGIVYEPILENTWIVSDPVKNSSIGFVRMYLDLFVMFTLFFISGYFIPNSLKNKTDRVFILSKFKRIMLPWMVAVFTMIPAYKAIFLYSRGLPQEAWYSYFHLFQRVGGDLSNFADNPVQNWLWFLPVLFLFQILYLGLSKTKLLSLNISIKTGVIMTLIIGIIYSMVISTLELRGWYNSPIFHFQRERLLIYFMVFLLGSLCYKLKVFESTHKNKKLYIWANVALTLSLGIFTVVALNFFFNMIDPVRNYFFVTDTIDRITYYTSVLISMFSFLYILIYTFRFSLNKSNWLMKEVNKNSYAVYIIHLPIIGVFALLLLNISMPAIIKFLLVTVLTFIISNIIVYAYRQLFQKAFSKNVFTIATPLAAILLTIAIYVNQTTTSLKVVPSTISRAEVTTPKVGLHMAVIDGNLEAVKQHIKVGTDLDIREPSGGSSPLITAAVFGKTESALLLIEAGADVNFRNKEGSTPLHTAAFFCHTEIIEALLDNGADASLKNQAGSTALESVIVPFDAVEDIYIYFEKTLGPLGLALDYERLKQTRPKIAEMLK